MKSYFTNSKVYHVTPNNESYRFGKYKDGKRRLVPISKSEAAIEKVRAVSDAINVRILTQRFSEPIYDANYGVNWNKFIGRSYSPSLIAELSHEIREAILIVSNVKDCTIDIKQKNLNTFVVLVTVYVENLESIELTKTVTL